MDIIELMRLQSGLIPAINSPGHMDLGSDEEKAGYQTSKRPLIRFQGQPWIDQRKAVNFTGRHSWQVHGLFQRQV